MKAVFSERQLSHVPEFFVTAGRKVTNPEQPGRAERLLGTLETMGVPVFEAESHGAGPRVAVHSPQYLDFLEHAHEDWQLFFGVAGEVMPSMRPLEVPGAYPRSIVGRAGWHMADLACPIGPSTWEAACASADTAVTAADMVAGGERAVYALCRPPGHHAHATRAGGFCYLNNTAIVAERLRALAPRVAVLDIDVHHGNGTQAIFYRRRDVFTVSVHADPADYYPFFWGHAHENGAEEGDGYNLNVPLPVGSGDDLWLDAVTGAVAAISAFEPAALVLALGLDAYEGDPLAGGAVTTAGFGRLAGVVAELGVPTVIVQEGGYLCDGLGDNLESFLAGFAAGQ
jgi:acetoin utilization deacetylase AcuC-like enzyme